MTLKSANETASIPAGTPKRRRGWAPWGVALGLGALTGIVYASLPPAGSTIGNQATAEYVDTGGEVRRVYSNTVKTIVQQVYEVDIEPAIEKRGVKGDSVLFPFTVLNPGNGNDSYQVTVNEVTDICEGTPLVYRDVQPDGQPDGPELNLPVTTDTLAPGGTQNFVMRCTISTTAVVGETGSIEITATSNGDDTKSDSVIDKVVISEVAMDVTKSYDIYAGPRGAMVEVTLLYQNTGPKPTDINVSDDLPVGFEYVENSAIWDQQGGVNLTDANDTEPAAGGGLVYSYTGGNAGDHQNGRLMFTAMQVQAYRGGSVKFRVEVPLDYVDPDGFNNIINIAKFGDGSPGSILTPTNPAVFKVKGKPGLDFDDPDNDNQANAPRDNVPGNGEYFVESATKGSVVQFYNVVKNTGDERATFDIVVDANLAGTNYVPFPGASTPMLRFWNPARQEATSALTDSDGNGIIDTGPMEPGQVKVVVLEVALDASAVGDGPFAYRKTATSTTDPSLTDTMYDVLGKIEVGQVDLTNGRAGCVPTGNLMTDQCTSGGAGPGPGTEPVTVATAVPGDKVSFPLYIKNFGGAYESFGVNADADNTFNPPVIYTNWNVRFFIDADGMDAGNDGMRDDDATTQLVETGVIAPNTYKLIWAEVEVPSAIDYTEASMMDNDAFLFNFYFQAIATTGGAQATMDVKLDQIKILKAPSLSVAPDQSADIKPTDCAVHQHWVQNNGNIPLGANGNELHLTLTNTPMTTPPKFITRAFWENPAVAAPDGLLGNDDVEITANPFNFADGLAVGEQHSILIEVCPGQGVVHGDTVNTNVEWCVTPPNGNPANAADQLACDSADDHTEVVDVAVNLTKSQQVLPSCKGEDLDPLGYNAAAADVNPGECICYKIDAENTSVDLPAGDVVIYDEIPAWTTYEDCQEFGQSCARNATLGQFATQPADETDTNPFTVEVKPMLPPGATATLTFCVQVEK